MVRAPSRLDPPRSSTRTLRVCTPCAAHLAEASLWELFSDIHGTMDAAVLTINDPVARREELVKRARVQVRAVPALAVIAEAASSLPQQEAALQQVPLTPADQHARPTQPPPPPPPAPAWGVEDPLVPGQEVAWLGHAAAQADPSGALWHLMQPQLNTLSSTYAPRLQQLVQGVARLRSVAGQQQLRWEWLPSGSISSAKHTEGVAALSSDAFAEWVSGVRLPTLVCCAVVAVLRTRSLTRRVALSMGLPAFKLTLDVPTSAPTHTRTGWLTRAQGMPFLQALVFPALEGAWDAARGWASDFLAAALRLVLGPSCYRPGKWKYEVSGGCASRSWCGRRTSTVAPVRALMCARPGVFVQTTLCAQEVLVLRAPPGEGRLLLVRARLFCTARVRHEQLVGGFRAPQRQAERSACGATRRCS